MICQKCGTEFDSNFCPNCGAPAKSDENPTSGHENWENWKPLPSHPFMQNTRRKKLKPGQIVGAVFGSIVLLFVLIIVIAIIMPSGSNKGEGAVVAGTNSVVQKASPKSSMAEATKVDCKVLYKDYEDNAISADKKYKDKIIELTGTIADIDRDIAQSPYITFNLDEYGAQSIKMSFNNDDTVAALKKGQTVTVTGTCNGTFASTIVTLSDCKIVK